MYMYREIIKSGGSKEIYQEIFEENLRIEDDGFNNRDDYGFEENWMDFKELD